MSTTTMSSSQAGLATFHRTPGPRRCPATERLANEGHTDLYCIREAGHTGLHRQDDHTWWSTRSTCADDRLEVTRTGEACAANVRNVERLEKALAPLEGGADE